MSITPTLISSTVNFISPNLSASGAELSLLINGIDQTSKMKRQGFGITDSYGAIKGMDITVASGAATTTGNEVIMLDKRSGKRIFAGLIKERAKKVITKSVYIEDLMVQDYTLLIDQVKNGVTEEFTDETEKSILANLFASYAPDIIVGSYVITGSSVSLTLDNSSLRAAIDQLAGINGRKWYVDYNKQLHYFNPLAPENAPFGLSDNPDNSTTFKYKELEYSEDELDPDNPSGSFTCWEPGLFSGQWIEITCAALSWSEQGFFIYEVSTSLIGGTTANPQTEYQVTFGKRPKRITSEIIDQGEIIDNPETEMSVSTSLNRYTIGTERSFDTAYHNTANGTLLVMIDASISIAADATSIVGTAFVIARVDSSESNLDTPSYSVNQILGDVALYGLVAPGGGDQNQVRFQNTLFLAVPPGYYYKIVTSVDGNASINTSSGTWAETLISIELV
jgi:hypothetical protein